MSRIAIAQTALAVLALSTALIGQQTTTPQAAGQPFGLTMGMSIDELRRVAGSLTPQSQGLALGKVPRPHPDFDGYLVVAGPKTGLCLITAVGKNIDTNIYGDGLKNKFQSIRAQLIERYGQPTTQADRVRTGSIWDEPEDWMMGLLQDERDLSSGWRNLTGFEPGTTMMLTATAQSRNKGRVLLAYMGHNYEACSAEERQSNSSAF